MTELSSNHLKSLYLEVNNDEIPSILDLNQSFFRELLQNSPDIIYRLELYPKFKFTYLSPSIENILGYTLKEYEQNPKIPIDITHPDDMKTMLSKFDGNSDFSKPKTVRHKHKNGNYVYLEDYTMPIYDKDGNLIGLQGISCDVTKRKERENKLKRMTYYDGLTNLYNKLYFEKQVHTLNQKENTPVGVIFCDLDNLKCTNDSLGHNFGDDLIVQASEMLKLISPKNSIISRIGGDEFVILLRNSSLKETKDFYLSLTDIIENQQSFYDDISIKMSIGYAFCESSIGNIRNTIYLADKNMYANKSKKKI